MRTFSRTSKFGVKRIVRDNYRGLDWYKIGDEVRKRDNYTCFQCGTFLGKGKGEVHHLRELSKGGVTTKANLVTLCQTCHNSKHRHLRK